MDKKHFPIIVIKYNRFLDPIFIDYIRVNPDLYPKWKNWVPPNKEEVKKRIENYKKEWRLYDKVILETICDVLSLSFRQNIIDVYIVSGNPRDFSDPIVIKSGYHPRDFVDVLAHELIHRLFQDNNARIPWSRLSEMFPEESRLTTNHIIVFAVLKYIYLDVLKDKSRLDKDIKSSQNSSYPDYTKAWEIVEKIGHINLIKKIKQKISPPSN